jgi:SAM-dependent methyltransferase
VRELLLGCGSDHRKKLGPAEVPLEWSDLTTLDVEPAHKPDVTHDLNVLPWPFADDSFDEVHAYEVLEHLGQQGDYKSFFAHFAEIWRILKPGGVFYGTVPAPDTPWVWADPGHTRVIRPETLIFLYQPQYSQVGRTAMSDYRSVYRADFDPLHVQQSGWYLNIALKAVKPSRCSVCPSQ